MFTKNWDAVFLAAVYQAELPNAFCKDMTGSAQSVNSAYGQFMLQIGAGTSNTSVAIPSISILRTSTAGNAGVVLGTGNTAPAYDDFKLSGDIISKFNYTQTTQKTVTENGVQLSATYSITNTGTEAFTISEIGLIASATSGSNEATKLLLERTVLDSPVTIEPGGVGQVTYTININMPNA